LIYLLKITKKPLLWSAGKVNQVTQQLYNVMDAALDVVALITPYRPKKSIFSWWNPELHELPQLAHRAHDQACRHPGDNDKWQDYRTKRRTLKNLSLKARKKSWQQFTADQVSPKQDAKLHTILQRQAYNKLGLIQRNDRSLTESQEESHEIIMQEHFPGLLPLMATEPCTANFDPNATSTCPPHPVLVESRRWINHTTMDLAFKQFRKHKCPGPDGYRPIGLCNLPHKARELLIHLYNAIIQLKYTPKLWRSSEVIFLLKPGKEDYTDR
jgi:hypothetical protein